MLLENYYHMLWLDTSDLVKNKFQKELRIVIKYLAIWETQSLKMTLFYKRL